MSEFSSPPPGATAQETPPSPPPSAVMPAPREGLLQRRLLWGLTPPWLAGFGLIIALAGVHLLVPDAPSTAVNEGFSGGGMDAGMVTVLPTVDSEQLHNEVADMVGGVRAFADTNREAISRLAETVKAYGERQAETDRQLAAWQAESRLLASRLAALEAHATPAPSDKPAHPAAKHSALAGMQLDAVQHGMAWVLWQGKSWAVKAGDRLGPVTIIAIDAPAREVSTSAGVLR
ncbi:conjugal transfer protein TraP [Sodalis endosymbiont of Spalangia cameroni]|uniref:conjugal transfer protein TraP n=1 Tax=Sodalis praecaptivus TaxID=1239307 RepID=UPI0031F8AE13